MNSSFRTVTRPVSKVFSFLFCVGLLAGLAFGQATSSSSISGIVTDQQGAAIPGTDVKLIDPSTNTTLSASANESGRYIFLNVLSGKYALTFTKIGFNVYRVDAIEVEVVKAERQRSIGVHHKRRIHNRLVQFS